MSEVPKSRDGWRDYFLKRNPRPSAVRNLVLSLHRAQQYSDVVAMVEAALIHDRSQPWMYDVLAIAMKLDGRPAEDVERALLSRVDFTGADVNSMIYSAAYLTRFGATTEALRMYRQASVISPARPEPYVLGLKLARRERNADAVGWAVCGVLKHAWINNYEAEHARARNAARDAQQWLRDDGQEKKAAELARSVAQADRRDLHVRLTWNGRGDLDLSVEEPGGSICSHKQPMSPGGGYLLHDGSGPVQKECYDEYVCPLGMPGDYRVTIRHVHGDIVGKRAQLTVTRYKGTPNEVTRKVSVSLGVDDRTVRVALRGGRRTEPATVIGNRIMTLDEILNTTSPRRSVRDAGEARIRRVRITPEQVRQARQVGAGVGIGFQPVIAVIPDGIGMQALAVVSADRRYVRISTNVFFNSISDVFTFSFLSTGGAGGGGFGGGAVGAGGGGQANQP